MIPPPSLELNVISTRIGSLTPDKLGTIGRGGNSLSYMCSGHNNRLICFVVQRPCVVLTYRPAFPEREVTVRFL